MPQWRKLHTKSTESLDLNDMPDDFTRLLWVLLPLKLCREGRGIDMPSWVKAQIFPLRSDITLEQVESALCWYHDRGMIERYQAKGRPYFQVVNWHKYQGKTEREADSPYPSPEIGTVKEKEDIDIDSDASRKTYSRPTQELVKTNLPPHINTGGLDVAWDSWRQYHEERKKPLTVSTALKQFKQFERWGPSRAIAAIDHSISQGYVGLVEPKENGKPQSTSPAEAEIMAHIGTYGTRQDPSFNGDTDKVMRAAGGYRALCKMSEWDAVKAIRNAQKAVKV